MNEFANFIDIVPLSKVAFSAANIASLLVGASWDRFIVEEFTFSPSSDTSDPGTLTSVNQTFYSDNKSEATSVKYHTQQPVLLRLTKTDGKTVILGSKSFPAYVNIVPGIQRLSILLSLKTPEQLTI